MSFLREDQIIDLKMTPEGKEKFANGLFKPKYFTLGDSDLIYSQDNTNITENSTKVHDRIKDVPRLEAQVCYGNKRTNKNHSNLGTSISNSQDSPSFIVTTRLAEMESVGYTQENQVFDDFGTSQVNLRDVLSYLRSQKDDSGVSLDVFDNSEVFQSSFDDTTLDGFRFFIESNGFSIDISESNGSSDFDFRLFEVTKDSDNHESLKEVVFEEEGNYFFSELFNIQTDEELPVKQQQEIIKPSELHNLKESEEC